jgi:hypothetical protein
VTARQMCTSKAPLIFRAALNLVALAVTHHRAVSDKKNV